MGKKISVRNLQYGPRTWFGSCLTIGKRFHTPVFSLARFCVFGLITPTRISRRFSFMQQLKAAFHVIDHYKKSRVNLTKRISTDRYDHRNKTEVCLAAEWFPYRWTSLAVIVKFIRKPAFKGYFLKCYQEKENNNKEKKKSQKLYNFFTFMFEHKVHVFTLFTKVLFILELWGTYFSTKLD